MMGASREKALLSYIQRHGLLESMTLSLIQEDNDEDNMWPCKIQNQSTGFEMSLLAADLLFKQAGQTELGQPVLK